MPTLTQTITVRCARCHEYGRGHNDTTLAVIAQDDTGEWHLALTSRVGNGPGRIGHRTKYTNVPEPPATIRITCRRCHTERLTRWTVLQRKADTAERPSVLI